MLPLHGSSIDPLLNVTKPSTLITSPNLYKLYIKINYNYVMNNSDKDSNSSNQIPIGLLFGQG